MARVNLNRYDEDDLLMEEYIEEDEELGHAETFADNYMPSKVHIGRHHPDPVVETASLSSVEPPDVKYEMINY